MTNAMLAGHDVGPSGSGGLDALLAAAGRDCSGVVLVQDDAGSMTGAVLDRLSTKLSGGFRLAGLQPGERVLIIAGTQTMAIVSLIGALRAGLEPAVVGYGLGPVELAAHVRAAGAVAIAGPTGVGPDGIPSSRLGDTYLSAASIADSIRMIATYGPDPVDGSLDINPAPLEDLPDLPDSAAAGNAPSPKIGTFHGAASAPTLIMHRQAALLADALSLVEQARINPSRRIISTLPPATLAGLVAGPFAMFLGASSLVLHGPFDARRFLAACDEEPGYHLVVPAGFAPVFADKRLAAHAASIIAVSRYADEAAFELPRSVDCDRALVDLYAFGEDALLAQRRANGEARPPGSVTEKSPAGGLGAKLNRARAAYFETESSESR